MFRRQDTICKIMLFVMPFHIEADVFPPSSVTAAFIVLPSDNFRNEFPKNEGIFAQRTSRSAGVHLDDFVTRRPERRGGMRHRSLNCLWRLRINFDGEETFIPACTGNYLHSG